MKKEMIIEEKMETMLTNRGYDIYETLDDGKVVDSTLVIEYAIEEGYKPVENVEGIYEFYK